jgi:SAM-dependent methyltransferase
VSLSPSEVRTVWEDRARNAALSEDNVTHSDRYQRTLEIEVLLQYLPRNQRVLDVGCGNGFSTQILAKHSKEVVGIDYSEGMIGRARQVYGHASNILFQVRDILSLELPPSSFDVAVSQRCLINLTCWEDQQRALANIAHVLKSGGCLFLQEGTRQGRERLNQVREMLGLPRMPAVAFNLDFDEEKLWPFLRRYFEIVEVRRFGLYDFVSRVVHALLSWPDEPKYDAPINDVASRVATKLRGTDDLSREFSAFLRRLDTRVDS